MIPYSSCYVSALTDDWGILTIIRRSKNKATITELLRREVAEADTPLAIERDTAVKRAALRSFRGGEQSLRLDIVDRLAAHFGIEVRRKRRH